MVEYVTRMPRGCFLVEGFQPCPKRPWGKPRTCWREHISGLAVCLFQSFYIEVKMTLIGFII